MSGEVIPDSNHVSRYCKPSAVYQDRPLVAAFVLRINEANLSVNWLEFLGTRSLEGAIRKVRSGFVGRGYQLRPNGRFVALNVGRCREAATQVERQIRVKHLPIDGDCSHAGIVGIRENDLELAAEITRIVGPLDVYPALE